MSAVKGQARENVSERILYVGFTSVVVKAFNPSRDELAKLLGLEPKDDAEEIIYSSKDKDGNERIRLAFWLQDEESGKFYNYSFFITQKTAISKDEQKVQIINSTADTTWAAFLPGSEEFDEEGIPSWFKEFQNKQKEVLGKKWFRKSLMGEEELAVLLKGWLGRLNWKDPETEVNIDTNKLFKEDFREIRELIDSNYATPFVILLGVRTDANDKTKKYQQVYGKKILPNGFLNYIKNDFKFPSDYSKNLWEKFKEKAEGQYGPTFFFDLCPKREYDEREDIASADETKVATNSDY